MKKMLHKILQKFFGASRDTDFLPNSRVAAMKELVRGGK